MIQMMLFLVLATQFFVSPHTALSASSESEERGWKLYTNARYGFSVRYPGDWRLGNPLPDGAGVTIATPIEHSLVALSGHMNIVAGKSQDGRQTLDEFVSAHRRIMTELYGKKSIAVTWKADQDLSLAGFPAKQLTFTYRDDKQGEMIEHHIMSLGHNEGRGVRVKVPLADDARLMQPVMQMLKTYQPGRDQNAVSPLVPNP
ncbi:MAG: hypothetical protein FJ247_09945 [Nitrospira sp.]|nr:hypothetical protein [Nitrospira sp.]